MNQGSVDRFRDSNGVWQDGALLIYFLSRHQWVAVFLAFQYHCFHTDDVTGHAIPGVCDQEPVEETVRIIAALVNPSGHDPGQESVTLINISPESVELNGWALADKHKRKHPLNGIRLMPGQAVTVPLTGEDVQQPAVM